MQISSDDEYLSLFDAYKAIKRRKIKPSELVKAHLQRIQDIDSKIGAYQVVFGSEAISAARSLDELISQNKLIGPFHGIPFAVKDICDYEGSITTCGSKLFEKRVSQNTAIIVSRILKAGGVLLGKTKTVELAFGGWGTNQHMGTPLNPWDTNNKRVCGGSSAGSAAAVASDMAICAVGTDTGGSVRLPAAFCGLTGLKVTENLLPTDGIMPLSQILDTPGPIARSVRDVAIMFSVLLGKNGARLEQDVLNNEGLFASTERGVKNLNIGVLDDVERLNCTSEVLRLYDSALETLEAEGATIKVFKPPISYSTITSLVGDIISIEAYQNHGKIYNDLSNPMDDDVRERVLRAKDFKPFEKKNLLLEREENIGIFQKAVENFDALLTPTTLDTAPLIDDVDQRISPGHFTRPFNYFGMCALSLPMGLSVNKLPLSLQICAKPNDEEMAIRIGACVEKHITLERKLFKLN